MKIYLIQHGKAKSEQEDKERPLNFDGIEQTKKVALKFLDKNLVKPHTIFCSKKLRAKQTAEILAEFIKPINGVKETDGLNPDDDVRIWYEKIKNFNEDIMIVGHLPHLKKFCSLLIFQNENHDAINFINSGIICIEKINEEYKLLDTVLPD
ncbi:MAG: phosphohistidine phosphatase SixA [Candidatus Goldbacteria bacterium]|nr:phosphohistidine phosphatase SixA [Candidatus Goldiibacteriota bacterium]